MLQYPLFKTIIFRKNNRGGSQADLIESRQGHDGVRQALSAQVDQHGALTRVEKMQLEGYQLRQPTAAQGLPDTGVLFNKSKTNASF